MCVCGIESQTRYLSHSNHNFAHYRQQNQRKCLSTTATAAAAPATRQWMYDKPIICMLGADILTWLISPLLSFCNFYIIFFYFAVAVRLHMHLKHLSFSVCFSNDIQRRRRQRRRWRQQQHTDTITFNKKKLTNFCVVFEFYLHNILLLAYRNFQSTHFLFFFFCVICHWTIWFTCKLNDIHTLTYSPNSMNFACFMNWG